MLKKMMVVLVMVLMMNACSNGIKGVAEPPKVSVYSVRMANMSLTEGNLLVALRVTNPNSYALPLNGLDYKLSLNGINIADGEKVKNFTIDANQDRIIEIPVKFSLLTLLRTIPGIVKTGRFTYDLSGNAHFPIINLPFQRTGQVGSYR
jgi:LEA14-like dessication related protein